MAAGNAYNAKITFFIPLECSFTVLHVFPEYKLYRKTTFQKFVFYKNTIYILCNFFELSFLNRIIFQTINSCYYCLFVWKFSRLISMRFCIFVCRFCFYHISSYNTFPYIGVQMYIMFAKYLKPIIMKSRSKLLKRMNSVIKDKNKKIKNYPRRQSIWLPRKTFSTIYQIHHP